MNYSRKITIVGFVDIANSTKISNEVDISLEWRIKECFLEAANKRSRESGIIILNHAGDGFLFMVDRSAKGDWTERVLSFQRSLVHDFNEILASVKLDSNRIQTGLRFGVAAGEILVGQSRNGQHLMAVGSAINLASRFCAMADIGEMIVCSSVGSAIGILPDAMVFKKSLNLKIKGYDRQVRAFSTSPETGAAQNETYRLGTAF